MCRDVHKKAVESPKETKTATNRSNLVFNWECSSKFCQSTFALYFFCRASSLPLCSALSSSDLVTTIFTESIIWLHLDSDTSKLGIGHTLVLPFATLLAFSFSLHSCTVPTKIHYLLDLPVSCLSTRLALSRASPEKVFPSLRDCLCVEHFLGVHRSTPSR